MLDLITLPKAVGLEVSSSLIKVAELAKKQGRLVIQKLFLIPQPFHPEDVKQLYIKDPIVVSGLEGNEVLVRFLHLPITKKKDIDGALQFQAESIIPYPIENAVLARQILSQNQEGTNLTVLSVRKDLIEEHLNHYNQLGIVPEVVSCVPDALCQFGKHFVTIEDPYYIIHCGEKTTTCILVSKGKILSSLTSPEGFELLDKGFQDDNAPLDVDFTQLLPETYPNLFQAVKKMQQGIVKINYALSKSLEGGSPAGVIFTGEIVNFNHLTTYLAEKLSLPLLKCKGEGISSMEIERYAVPIGLAAGALLPDENSVDFRKQEFTYPNPWKRLLKPLLAYFGLMLTLSTIFYFFGQFYLMSDKNKLKQEFVNLLSDMNKPYQTFEGNFLTKNPGAAEKSNGEVIPVEALSEEDLLQRIEFLQKDLLATPDSFPLFANIPRVSDVLAWLSTHPQATETSEEGLMNPRLQLENFSYVLVKRPMQGKKQDKYQVKVELEFSSPTPKWAREFHDALIAPNTLVDPKGEVKWSSNRGKYKTSFFLKDKTNYQTQ